MMFTPLASLALLLFLPSAYAHGSHGQDQVPMPEYSEWAAYHMAGPFLAHVAGQT
jgi:hypothetical protein